MDQKMNRSPARLTCLLAGASTMLLAAGAQAQSWPAKPIHIITVEAGSASDVTLRLLGQPVSAALGQPIVVDNRASSSRPEQAVLKAPPDGYSFLYWGSPLWTAPFFEKVNFDPVKDFSPVSLAMRFPSVLVINTSLPAKSVKELVDLARAKPGSLNAGVAGVGSTPYLAAMLFTSMSGTQIETISYKSAVQGLSDLTAGRIQLFFPSLGTALPQITSGKLRALAVTTPDRSELLPDVPPIAATYPGYQIMSAMALFGPANLPQPIVGRMSDELVKAVKDPAMSTKLLGLGFESVGSTPAQLGDTMRRDMSIIAGIIKEKGIKIGE